MDEGDTAIFSLVDNLGTSYVDESNLFHTEILNQRPIGMANFRSTPIRKNKSKNAKERWKNAADKIKYMKDPWAKFEIDKYPVENVIRHRYDPVKKQWKQDDCVVKMETKQFANGAMRACFRLKKLSNFSHEKCWKSASNYVAKRYLSPDMKNENYFNDVKVQMDAKLWAEIYNRFNPPKKIDMFQIYILEFKDRPDSPLFHLEHFIEGNYIKYNSNSGYVDDEHLRSTPHAFSHFTFECSNHEQIVVDIQGVGDLYTDPQIHTSSGNDYGDGNLGLKGFALFFHSHICNDICRSLGLSPFDLSPNEIQANNTHTSIDFHKSNITTKSKGDEEPLFFASKFINCRKYHPNDEEHAIFEADEGSPSSSSGIFSNSLSSDINMNLNVLRLSSNNSGVSNNTSIVDSPFFSDEAFKYVNSKMFDKPRPSTVSAEMDNLLNTNAEYLHRLQDFTIFESILAKVHLELCKYHEVGRFLASDMDEIDYESGFFHLKHAANLGEVDALLNLARIYMQIPRDILPEYTVEDTEDNYDIGFDYMSEAAEKCDKIAMHFVAKAFDTGLGLSKKKSIDWRKAIDFYRKILSENREEKSDDSSIICEPSSDFDSDYVIISRLGEMYLEGGNGVEKNPEDASDLFLEAADKAVQYGKGRLANKYYMMSDKALALVE